MLLIEFAVSAPVVSILPPGSVGGGGGALFLTGTDPFFLHDLRFFPPLHDLGLDLGLVALVLLYKGVEVFHFVGWAGSSELVRYFAVLLFTAVRLHCLYFCTID
jgi:hypothetical protein